MEVEYTPIKPEDIFPKIDSETIAKFLKGEAGIKEHQIETIDYLLNSLKNMFIPILNGKAKDICIDVNKELQSKTIIN